MLFVTTGTLGLGTTCTFWVVELFAVVCTSEAAGTGGTDLIVIVLLLPLKVCTSLTSLLELSISIGSGSMALSFDSAAWDVRPEVTGIAEEVLTSERVLLGELLMTCDNADVV